MTLVTESNRDNLNLVCRSHTKSQESHVALDLDLEVILNKVFKKTFRLLIVQVSSTQYHQILCEIYSKRSLHFL